MSHDCRYLLESCVTCRHIKMFCGWTCDRGIENSERKDNYNLMSETSLNLKHEETISSVLGAKKHFYIILFCF